MDGERTSREQIDGGRNGKERSEDKEGRMKRKSIEKGKITAVKERMDERKVDMGTY